MTGTHDLACSSAMLGVARRVRTRRKRGIARETACAANLFGHDCPYSHSGMTERTNLLPLR